MAVTVANKLDAVNEARMREFSATLTEKDRRRFAAFEAKQQGYGESNIFPALSAVLDERSNAASKSWIIWIRTLPPDRCDGPVPVGKKKISPDSEVEQNLKSLLETRTAGDPDDEEIVFTDLSPATLSEKLTALQTPVSDQTIRDWMDAANYRLRKIRKDIPGGSHPDRNAQFENIAELIDDYEADDNPWFSIDTKAKEHLGNLYRAGRVRSLAPFLAFDHDFPGWADGVVIPHGIYDHVHLRGHINIGLSHDTSEFACDSFAWYWNRIGKQRYPDATSILLTCDGGGSNSSRKYIFKHDLQQLANRIGIEIRVAHYPPYCSKYNPIERRFFPHLGRACSGMLFDTLENVVSLMRRAVTSTGLTTTVNVIRRAYETGRNATEAMKQDLKILFDDLLPNWNYTAVPEMRQ